jgi:predicted ATPase
MLLSNSYGDIEAGSRYCDLSLKLMDIFKAREWLPRVYASCYGFCYVYDRPSGENLDPLLTAYRSGLGTGDFEVRQTSTSTVVCHPESSAYVLPLYVF